jgi:hypothetical protein
MSIASSVGISGGRRTLKKGGEPVLRPCHLGSTYQHNDSTNCRLLTAHDLLSHRRVPKRHDELRRINWPAAGFFKLAEYRIRNDQSGPI